MTKMISDMSISELADEVVMLPSDFYFANVDETKLLAGPIGYTRDELLVILQKFVEEAPDF